MDKSYGNPTDPEDMRFFHMPHITHIRMRPREGTSTGGKNHFDLISYAQDKIQASILATFGTIEEIIEEIIMLYFFETDSAKSATFDQLVLKSDFSFSAKLRLLFHIVKERGVPKNAFDETMFFKLMEYRNAFAHGRISSDGVCAWIDYFKNKPKSVELNHAYLTQIKECLQYTIETANQIRFAPRRNDNEASKELTAKPLD